MTRTLRLYFAVVGPFALWVGFGAPAAWPWFGTLLVAGPVLAHRLLQARM